MDGFATHGLEHLSPSSLNQYLDSPAHWVLTRLIGYREPASPPATRGRAAEFGVHLGLAGADLAKCVAAAEKMYDQEMAGSNDERDERAKLAAYVEHGLDKLRPLGKPSSYQDRIEITLDDVPVPVIGFTDWIFEDRGLIVDLKTTGRLPSSLSAAHARQGAVYLKAYGNFGMRFVYVKPARGRDGRVAVTHELGTDDARQHIETLRQVALHLERFLSLSGDPQELVRLVPPPDYSHFRWSSAEVREAGREYFGY